MPVVFYLSIVISMFFAVVSSSFVCADVVGVVTLGPSLTMVCMSGGT